jgi:membrane protein
MRLQTFSTRTKQKEEHARVHASPWKLGGLTPWQLARRVYRRFGEDEVLTRSAALSYYFISALIPMLFLLVATLGLFAKSHDLQSSLFSYAGRFMPPDAFSLLHKTLREIASSSSGIKLILGLALALWSGSAGISSLMDALNHCYRVKDSRPYWKRKLISITLTIAISALTVVALVIVLSGAAIARFAGAHTGLSSFTVMIWQIAQWPVAFFFVVFALALIYYWTPDIEQKWQWITPGSLLGVVLWLGASVLFRVYLHYFNSYGRTYGSLGAVIVLLFWLYITAMAILSGGEINSEIENAAAKRGHPEAKETGEKVA